MERIKIRGKGIRRIIIPQAIAVAAGARTNGPLVIKGKKKKRRGKGTRATRFFEKLAMGQARANIRGGQEYIYRHRRSNRKKKNGWLRDLGENLMRGNKKGRKAFRLSRALSM